VKQTNGVFYFTARIDGVVLALSSMRKDGNFRHSAVYEFVALPMSQV